MTDLRAFSDVAADDAPLVGGKGLSLARLVAAGLPVPPGLCITADAHRRLRGRSIREDPLAAALLDACRLLGGPFAVRSSATAEDGALLSFAGQQETFLGIDTDEDILSAVERCWASLDGERTVSYRRQQGVNGDIAMAVVVQRLVPAEVAGVLFTRDPLDPEGRSMLVESAFGLGESVVSGRMMPDRFHLERDTGLVLDRHIADKMMRVGPAGEEPTPPELRTAPSLGDEQLQQLAELGRKVEAFFGEPRDIEFAYSLGRFWLLQARPITAGGMVDVRRIRDEEIAALRTQADSRGTVWSKFNLSEVLPAPTPMSWALARRLMSGRGGLGLMYRDLGFRPAPELDEDGAFDLVCGRPYCNLSREPRMHFADVPFEHPFAAIKADPRSAFYPLPVLQYRRFSWRFWALAPIQIPRLLLRFAINGARQKRLLARFAAEYRSRIAPAFRAEIEQAPPDLSRLSPEEVLHFFEKWCRRTLIDFPRESLKPTALAALALVELESKLGEVMPADKARDLARRLVIGARPDPEADLAGSVRDLAAGKLTREAFLARFGHRGSEEMEVARPRWGEEPAQEHALSLVAAHAEPPGPAERLQNETNLSAEQRALLLKDVAILHEYVGLRESAKNDLMRGYSLIRKALLELDRRFQLQGGIFYLAPEELPRLLAGEDFSETIIKRRRRRALVLGLDVPAVLFSDDLEAIGRPPTRLAGAEVLFGTPLSAGVAEGPALVLEHPQTGVPAGEEYVLVCPSTDPAWVPLFVKARALVMETGGVLSHGAIVAREFGLPAVAGLPGVVGQLRTGQRLRVDGAAGTVHLVD